MATALHFKGLSFDDRWGVAWNPSGGRERLVRGLLGGLLFGPSGARSVD